MAHPEEYFGVVGSEIRVVDEGEGRELLTTSTNMPSVRSIRGLSGEMIQVVVTVVPRRKADSSPK